MSTVQAYLADLRDERDAWMQANRTLHDMRQEASDQGAGKVSVCLGEAIKYAIEQEARALEVLVTAELVVKRMEAP